MNVPDLLEKYRHELPAPAVLTGGSGRLGSELTQLLPDLLAPTSSELDVLKPGDYLHSVKPKLIVHAAAYTDVAKAETERETCWQLNVVGTRNMALAAASLGAHFVLTSTDYVFDGNAGNYREDDPVGNTVNYYALTKLVAEEVARTVMPGGKLLIIRTSFRGRDWPHAKAFTDLFTSQDYIDKLVPQLALAVSRAAEIPFETLHIAGERRSSFELASERRRDVQPASRTEAAVNMPADVSLNTERWQGLLREWS